MSNADETDPAPQEHDVEQARRQVRRGAIPSSPEQLAAATPYEPTESCDDDRDEPDPEDSK